MSTAPLTFKRWPPAHPDRIQLYSLPTPNGIKVGVALEEMGLPYEPHRIDIMSGIQHSPEFLDLNPNGKIPAIIDPNGPGGGYVKLMESAAILQYLARKSGKFLPEGERAQLEVWQWLFFQVGHLGPMLGQFGHFHKFVRDKVKDPYPLERYTNEGKRLLKILDERLAEREYMLGEYSIVDMACFPWVECAGGFYNGREALELDSFTHVQRWLAQCLARPAVQRGMKVCAQ